MNCLFHHRQNVSTLKSCACRIVVVIKRKEEGTIFPFPEQHKYACHEKCAAVKVATAFLDSFIVPLFTLGVNFPQRKKEDVNR